MSKLGLTYVHVKYTAKTEYTTLLLYITCGGRDGEGVEQGVL